MIFERADGFFGRIRAVDVWRHQLETDVVGAKILFDSRGTFVVHDVHGWAESPCSEVGVEFGGGHELFAFRFIFYRLRQDGVGIKIVQDHDVFASLAGGMGETSGLVAVHFAAYVDCFDVVFLLSDRMACRRVGRHLRNAVDGRMRVGRL